MLAVLLLGQFMCIIDVLVTNVAMPSIAASLHASGASLQLVVGGYTFAYAMLLITGARLGDRYGRRRTYLPGVLIFSTASLACALAPDSQALIGFRLVQGAGAAVLVPQVFSIIQLNFTGPARARALSGSADRAGPSIPPWVGVGPGKERAQRRRHDERVTSEGTARCL
jgi:MFS family permease